MHAARKDAESDPMKREVLEKLVEARQASSQACGRCRHTLIRQRWSQTIAPHLARFSCFVRWRRRLERLAGLQAWRIEVVVGGVPRWDFFLGTTWKSVELKDWS